MQQTLTNEQFTQIFRVDNTQKKVEETLNKYFSGVKANIEVNMYAGIPHLRIMYYDFYPTKRVRHDIEDLLPKVEFEELTRDYSKDLVKDMLYNIYVEGIEFYYSVSDNCIKKGNLIEFVNEKLYDISLNTPQQE